MATAAGQVVFSAEATLLLKGGRVAYPQAERPAWDGDVFGSDGSVGLPPFPLAGSLPTDPAGWLFSSFRARFKGHALAA